jgi:haloacetate dehalogenase
VNAFAFAFARALEVVCADLRGYGRSGCPASTADHASYTKRAMAQDMVLVMEHLGSRRFSGAPTIVVSTRTDEHPGVRE